jgi:hypothetical protein
LADVTNSAKRVLKLAQKVSKQPEDKSTAEAWASVFGLEEKTAKSDPHPIYSQLQLVREEIESVKRLMTNTGIPSELYIPYLERVSKVVSVTNIAAPWKNYKQHIQPDVVLSLKYCAALLPEEEALSIEELQKILDKVLELRQEIDNSALSGHVYDFLMGQLEIIEKSIRQYPIKGSESIRRAFTDGFADLASRADDLRNEEDRAEAEKVAGIWASLKKAGSAVVEADRIATAYMNLIEKGQSAADAVAGLLQNS